LTKRWLFLVGMSRISVLRLAFFASFVFVKLTFGDVGESVPYRPLRYTHVVGQTDWYTCGAAAVATLLTYYYDDPATEGDILKVAIKETERSGKDPLKGLTALSLKRALERRGYAVKAYRVNLAQLADYFRRGGLPVIGHVTKPQLHFLTIAGIVEADLREGWARNPGALLAYRLSA